MRGPFAALDAGTNTMRLLVASVTEDGQLVEHCREQRFAMLGQGVDASGEFCQEAMERGWKYTAEFAQIMRAKGCVKGRFVATSASRDAANRQVFFDRVRELLGFEPELISGLEEAQLSYTGALSGAQLSGDPVLVVDSGGGSTEFAYGTAGGKLKESISINMGSRRLRERFLTQDPPTADQIQAAREFVAQQLESCPFELSSVRTFIGVAGTATSLSALILGLKKYNRKMVHRSASTVTQVRQMTQRLLATPVADIAAIGVLQPERAQMICAGALIMDEIAQRVGQPLQACESDILDGVILSMANGQQGHQFA